MPDTADHNKSHSTPRDERKPPRRGTVRDERGQDQPATKEDAQRSSGHVRGDDVLKDAPL
jgi:hypothetical protein